MKILLIISLILIGMIGKGQMNVGVKNDSLIIIPMNILTEGDPWNNGDVYIDLDNNDSIDINFYFIIVGGGEGARVDSQFKCFDGTSIITDTVQTHIINGNLDTIIMPCAVKLDSNQVIINTDYDTTKSYLSRYSRFGSETFINIRHWIDNQIHFVGFVKNIDGKDYLGWIKIRVEEGYRVYFYEWVMQDYALSIHEEQFPIEVLSTSYFNIVGQQIPKPITGFYIERKLTNKGVISTKYFKQ